MSFWVSAAAAIVAAGASYANNQSVARKQDNNLAASLRQQGQLQQQASAQTSQLINKTAASNDTGAQSSLLQQFTNALKAKQGNATTNLGQVGAVSDAYSKAANDASQGISQFGANRAGLMSAIDAPGVQRQGEAADLMRYGTGIGQLKTQSAADEFLSNMRLKGIRQNPWLTALGSVASSYAKSGGGGGSSSPSSDWGGGDGGGSVADSGSGYRVNLPFGGYNQ